LSKELVLRLRLVVPLILLTCLAPVTALAARVFGDIKIDGKPVAAGVPVKITRLVTEGGKSKAAADSTTTDKFGSYKLMVKETGKCVLSIMYDKQSSSLEVFSNKEATRYDLILEKSDGKWSLRRK
jgi:hypothetical protein